IQNPNKVARKMPKRKATTQPELGREPQEPGAKADGPSRATREINPDDSGDALSADGESTGPSASASATNPNGNKKDKAGMGSTGSKKTAKGGAASAEFTLERSEGSTPASGAPSVPVSGFRIREESYIDAGMESALDMD